MIKKELKKNLKLLTYNELFVAHLLLFDEVRLALKDFYEIK